MIKTSATLEGILLAGLSIRTNNKHIFESNPETNPIAATVQQYFYDNLPLQIRERKNPGRTFCAYTQYESDFNGDYTFFIGEEVSSLDAQPESLERLIIPAQKYTKFTNTPPGPMPDVCIAMWQEIWNMQDTDLGGERAYLTDFEIYDERSADHNQVTLDIYIGIRDAG